MAASAGARVAQSLASSNSAAKIQTDGDEHSPLITAGRSAQDSRGTLSLHSEDVDEERNYESITSSARINGVSARPASSAWEVIGILSVLLVGVFVSQADTTLLLAIIGTISGEFHDLENSSWLFSSYGLAICCAQPLYGKLSDIYGRKTMLQIAYFLFAIGGAVSGLGRSMSEIIIGRVIQGFGGAGMVSLVSILITDLVPLRDVAAYRSYVNVVQTIGRSAGGPIGGALAQTVGWRAAFVVQAPLTLLAMVLVGLRLRVPPPRTPSLTKDINGAATAAAGTGAGVPDANNDHDDSNNDHGESEAAVSTAQSTKHKWSRIDFLGALFSSTTILSGVLVLDIGGTKVSWSSPTIAILVIVFIVSATLFYVAESRWAREPIFPLALLANKHVVLTYVLLIVQVMSQIGLIFFIPLYFQVTTNASAAAAGAYMAITVVGNTVGGLLTGWYIKRYTDMLRKRSNRTGRYKNLMLLSSTSSITCFTLLLLTWRGDNLPNSSSSSTTTTSSFFASNHHPPITSSFVILGGFATGIAQSALFVDLAATVEESQMAIASSGLYLCASIGGVAGVTAAGTLFTSALRLALKKMLKGWPGGQEIAEKAASDITYVQHLADDTNNNKLHQIIVASYIVAFQHCFAFSLCCACIALVLSVLMREKVLRQ